MASTAACTPIHGQEKLKDNHSLLQPVSYFHGSDHSFYLMRRCCAHKNKRLKLERGDILQQSLTGRKQIKHFYPGYLHNFIRR